MYYGFSAWKWHFASFSVELDLRTYFGYRFAQRSLKKLRLKTSCSFLSSFLVRVLQPQIVFCVCVRSVPSNPKTVFGPQFPILFPFVNPVGKKTISIGQRRLRPLLEPDTSAIEWLLEKGRSFPCSPEKYDEGYRCIIDCHRW